MTFLRIAIRSRFLVEHDRFRKPVPSFRNHALSDAAREHQGKAHERAHPDEHDEHGRRNGRQRPMTPQPL